MDLNITLNNKWNNAISVLFTSSNMWRLTAVKFIVMLVFFSPSEFQVMTFGVSNSINLASNTFYTSTTQVPTLMNKPLSTYHTNVVILGMKYNLPNALEEAHVQIVAVADDGGTLTFKVINSANNAITLQYCYFQIIFYKNDSMPTYPMVFNEGIQINSTTLYQTLSQTSSSFFWGLNKFYLKNVATFEMTLSIDTTNCKLYTQNVNAFYTQYSFVGLLKRDCVNPTPYFLDPYCYDVCPPRYYTNNACIACYYACLTCQTDGVTCLTCEPNDHRVLVSGSCTPMPRFIQSGVSVALACTNPGCLNCNANQDCISCDTVNDFRTLNNGLCNPLPNYYETGVATAARCVNFLCFSCINNGNCLSCYPNTNRMLINGNCVPQIGYFQSNVMIASSCNQFHCPVCDSNGCLSCFSNQNRYAFNGVCIPLEGFYQNNLPIAGSCLPKCTKCTNAFDCQQCQDFHIFNGTNCQFNCLLIPKCATCLFSGINYYCFECKKGYVIHNDLCQPVCGDGYAIQNCDDGNLNDGDGCNRYCQVEKGYNCTEQNENHTSICSPSVIHLTLVYLLKTEGENKLTACFKMQPDFLKDLAIDWLKATQSPQFTISSADFSENSLLTLNLEYSFNPQNIQLNFNIANIHSIEDKILKWKSPFIQTNDNNKVKFYPEYVYFIGKIIHYLALMIGIINFTLFIIGFINTRMLTLQNTEIVQLVYFLIGSVYSINPTEQSLHTLRYTFGYNLIPNLYDYTSYIDSKFKGIKINTNFFNNFNISLLFIAIPFIGALICKLVDVATKKNRTLWQTAIGAQTFYALTYLSSMITACAVFCLINEEEIIPKIGSVFFIAFYLGYFLFFVIQPQFFQEFFLIFQSKPIHCRTFALQYIQKILIGALFAANIQYGIEIIFGFTCMRSIFLFIAQPYKEKMWKVIFNCLNLLIVEVLFIIRKHVQSENFNLYFPIALISMITFTTVFNCVFLYKEIQRIFFQNKMEVKPIIQQNKHVITETTYAISVDKNIFEKTNITENNCLQ